MARTLRPTEPAQRRLRDTSAALPRIDADTVVTALGAVAGEPIRTLLGPITLLAVREELAGRLQSTGGRPGLADTTRRTKIPLRDQDWAALEQLAAAVGSEGSVPSAGQVASVLLTLSVRHMMNELAKDPSKASSALRELASLAETSGDVTGSS
jgi:hypothetical protein